MLTGSSSLTVPSHLLSPLGDWEAPRGPIGSLNGDSWSCWGGRRKWREQEWLQCRHWRHFSSRCKSNLDKSFWRHLTGPLSPSLCFDLFTPFFLHSWPSSISFPALPPLLPPWQQIYLLIYSLLDLSVGIISSYLFPLCSPARWNIQRSSATGRIWSPLPPPPPPVLFALRKVLGSLLSRPLCPPIRIRSSTQ